jgi:phosphotransferase system HPr (HPr) family protein
VSEPGGPGAAGDGAVAQRRAVRVASPQGLHARPAARVVETARRFRAKVSLVHGATRASAKDLLDVLYLAAPCGTELLVEAEGDDAELAADAMAALFAALGREA